jgi:hypothetical protein
MPNRFSLRQNSSSESIAGVLVKSDADRKRANTILIMFSVLTVIGLAVPIWIISHPPSCVEISAFILFYLMAAMGRGHLAVNWICNTMGTRRFKQDNTSTNNTTVAVLTLGEGWHNNHHRFPRSARFGIAWYEVDVLASVISLMERLGPVWNVVRVTPRWSNGCSRRVPGPGPETKGRENQNPAKAAAGLTRPARPGHRRRRPNPNRPAEGPRRRHPRLRPPGHPLPRRPAP